MERKTETERLILRTVTVDDPQVSNSKPPKATAFGGFSVQTIAIDKNAGAGIL